MAEGRNIDRSANTSQKTLIKTLVESLKNSTPKDRQDTLSTLKRIFDDVIQHPNDDNYREIKLTSKTFINEVRKCPAAMDVMKMSGWVEDGDYMRLRDESDAKAISELLEQELQTTREPMFHEIENANTNTINVSSPKCCALTQDKTFSIIAAVRCGNGQLLRKLLDSYHRACVKKMKFEGNSIMELACLFRQIGIARILANEYEADLNSLDEDQLPNFFLLFGSCDTTESCQSLSIQFIKEFKIDIHKPCMLTVLNLAVLHKLFTIVKFLVEECEVKVNHVSPEANNGTPLHMAYGIGEENIAQYLIEHGANQGALDGDGRKPIDYKLYVGSTNYYATLSQNLIEKRVMRKNIFSFPSLQVNLDDITNRPNLEATPTQKDLRRHITDMASSYQQIGLELDVPYAELKLIRNDFNLPDPKEKCRKMLEVWLESDTSATWKKLCNALQEVEMGVLAEQIKKSVDKHNTHS